MRVFGMFIVVILFIAGTCCVGSTPAASATVGAWSRTCIAPNWSTGIPEPVAEQNSAAPSGGFAFTQAIPGGHWLTTYFAGNLLNSPVTTANVIEFLFYHECAHAKLKTSDEHLADCQGLRDMSQDIGVSAQAWNDITVAYNSKGRAFPSGGNC